MQREFRKAFNKVKAAMSAETVAFNVGDDAVNISDAHTEVVSDLNLEEESQPPATKAEASEAESVSDELPVPTQENATVDFSGDVTEVIDPSQIEGIANDQNFDSTMKQGFFPDDLPPERTAVETEEYAAGDLPAEPAEEIFETNEDVGSQISAEHEMEADVVSETNYSVDSEKQFDPDATVPFILVDENVEGPDPGSEDASSTMDFGSAGIEEELPGDLTENFVAEEELSSETASASQATDSQPEISEAVEEKEESKKAAVAAKSSAGKYVAILGGLGALLVLLVVSAIAIGWYATNGGFGLTTEDTNSAPSVEPSVEAEPTPDMTNTDVVVDDANSNSSSDSNSNTEDLDSSNTNSAESTETPDMPTTVSTPRSTRTPTISRPTRKPTRAPTKRPTRRPTKKPTRKPTKKPRDPGILQ
jgi:hypothetical protein